MSELAKGGRDPSEEVVLHHGVHGPVRLHVQRLEMQNRVVIKDCATENEQSRAQDNEQNGQIRNGLARWSTCIFIGGYTAIRSSWLAWRRRARWPGSRGTSLKVCHPRVVLSSAPKPKNVSVVPLQNFPWGGNS